MLIVSRQREGPAELFNFFLEVGDLRFDFSVFFDHLVKIWKLGAWYLDYLLCYLKSPVDAIYDFVKVFFIEASSG